MGRGRKAKPTTLHVLEGTFNATRHAGRANEPRPNIAVPEAPSVVAKNEIALAEWTRICEELLNVGLITALDRGAIAAYCIAYARWCKAEGEIGELTTTTEKSVIVNPLVTVANQAMEQMRKFLIEFGMTPSSRTKVRAIEQPKNRGNGKSRFFAG